MLWCFVLNPHRRSPYSNFLLELRDKLQVTSPATYEANRVLSRPPPPELNIAHPHMVVSALGDLGMYHVGADVNGWQQREEYLLNS